MAQEGTSVATANMLTKCLLRVQAQWDGEPQVEICGPHLRALTSRPYTLGWMKQLLWDPWKAAQRNHPQIDIINFR